MKTLAKILTLTLISALVLFTGLIAAFAAEDVPDRFANDAEMNQFGTNSTDPYGHINPSTQIGPFGQLAPNGQLESNDQQPMPFAQVNPSSAQPDPHSEESLTTRSHAGFDFQPEGSSNSTNISGSPAVRGDHGIRIPQMENEPTTRSTPGGTTRSTPGGTTNPTQQHVPEGETHLEGATQQHAQQGTTSILEPQTPLTGNPQTGYASSLSAILGATSLFGGALLIARKKS